MTHRTNILIDEQEVDVLIDFDMHFGQVLINKITDIKERSAIAPDLHDAAISDQVYNELHEFAADLKADKSANGRYSVEL